MCSRLPHACDSRHSGCRIWGATTARSEVRLGAQGEIFAQVLAKRPHLAPSGPWASIFGQCPETARMLQNLGRLCRS